MSAEIKNVFFKRAQVPHELAIPSEAPVPGATEETEELVGVIWVGVGIRGMFKTLK